MAHELICSCLRLSPAHWPPDHYTLLGLKPGEADTRRIEHCVQERMEKLRRYQLAHAEQVTEGMNRLAQALVCLTDPVAKKAYDAKLLSRKAKRRIVPTSFDVPSPSDEELPSPSPPRWLLLAWIVWLIIGLVGLGAVITYFPAIQASYHGEPRIRE